MNVWLVSKIKKIGKLLTRKNKFKKRRRSKWSYSYSTNMSMKKIFSKRKKKSVKLSPILNALLRCSLIFHNFMSAVKSSAKLLEKNVGIVCFSKRIH